MIEADVTVPRDVQRFEVFLYLSLLLDSLSAGFLSAIPDNATDDVRLFVNVVSAIVIVALVYLVWLAAQQRRNWARWTITGLFGLTALMSVGNLGDMELSLRAFTDMVSLGLTAVGLYYVFTPEANQWFATPGP
jgi:hypothetical protein